MKQRVNVTQIDINRGKRKSLSSCPVALAVTRTKIAQQFKRLRVRDDCIDFDNSDWNSGFLNWDFSAILPLKARIFILDFDQGLPVEPFSFFIDIDSGESQETPRQDS